MKNKENLSGDILSSEYFTTTKDLDIERVAYIVARMAEGFREAVSEIGAKNIKMLELQCVHGLIDYYLGLMTGAKLGLFNNINKGKHDI